MCEVSEQQHSIRIGKLRIPVESATFSENEELPNDDPISKEEWNRGVAELNARLKEKTNGPPTQRD